MNAHVVTFLLKPVERLFGPDRAVPRCSLLANIGLGAATAGRPAFGDRVFGSSAGEIALESCHVVWYNEQVSDSWRAQELNIEMRTHFAQIRNRGCESKRQTKQMRETPNRSSYLLTHPEPEKSG
jgi:hypothetical protein